MSNPYDAPQEESAPPLTLSEVKRRHGRGGVESADFIRIGLMMQLISAPVLLAGLLFLFISWVIAVPLLLLGACFFVPGRGLAAYKPWAWYAAVLVVLPLSVIPLVGTLFLILGGNFHWQILLLPVIFGFVSWVLLSHGGRDRYRMLCEATIKRKIRARQPKGPADIEPELFSTASPADEPPRNMDPFADPAGDR